MYGCVGLYNPGQRVFCNFDGPFVFDNPTFISNKMRDSGQGTRYNSLEWDSTVKNKSVFILKTKAVVHSIATAVVQYPLPFSLYFAKPFTYFEVLIEKMEKGHICVGLAYYKYPSELHLGRLDRSFGYHSNGQKFKRNDNETGTENGEQYGSTFCQGDIVGCGLDIKNCELFFTKNGVFLGVAYTGVYGSLHPSVGITGPESSVNANFYPPFKYTLANHATPSLAAPSITPPISSTQPSTATALANTPISKPSKNNSCIPLAL